MRRKEDIKLMNHMKEVAQLLGVELYEEFCLKNHRGMRCRITENGTKQNKVFIGSEKSPSLASTNVYINGQLYRVPNWNTNNHVMLDSNWSFYQQGKAMYATDGTKMVQLTKYDE